jgi:hypothetical protein
MKDLYDLMKSLLIDTFEYNGQLKRFFKAASRGQNLFHEKGNINEAIVELEVNGMYAPAMTVIKIPKGIQRDCNRYEKSRFQ